jgi:pimeloyl-ACP methyl ester carboxylesterase
MGEQQDDEQASARKQTLVFLHGSGDSARAWDRVTPLLSDFSCIALDLPGHGAQVARPGPAQMSVADYADAVRTTLARDGLAGVCLVGHSLGGAVALRLALEHPALVRRLVLVGTGARLRVLPALLDAAKQAPADAAERLVMTAFAPGNEREAYAYAARLAPTAQGVLYRDLAACDAFDMMAELGRIAQPTLILVGAEDRMTPPKYARFLAEHLEQATLVTVPDVGHYLPAEAPAAVAEAIRQWLAAAVARGAQTTTGRA